MDTDAIQTEQRAVAMADSDSTRLNQITESIIGCAFRVHNTLGHGFLESVYENALCHELRKSGLSCERQVRFDVEYDGVVVGHFLADLIVEDCVVTEIKVAKGIDEAHVAQCLNYLAATKLSVGLVLCFARRVLVKRLIL